VKAILHYSHQPATLDIELYCRCRVHNQAIADRMGVWVAVVRESMKFEDIELTFDEEPQYADLYRRITVGCEALRAVGYENARVYLCEHDVMYHPSHFDHHPTGLAYDINLRYYSPQHGYTVRGKGEIALSQLSGPLPMIEAAAKAKLDEIERRTFSCFEPTHGVGTYCANYPSLDIRHGSNTSWHLSDDTQYVHSLAGWTDFERGKWPKSRGE
jgi:hypothetical protein